MRRPVWTLALIGVLSVAPASAQAVDDATGRGQTAVAIKIEALDQGVVVTLKDAKLAAVAADLQQRSGIPIDLPPALGRERVSKQIQEATWDAAILMLFHDYNLTVEWADAERGRLRRIWVLASNGENARQRPGARVLETNASLQPEIAPEFRDSPVEWSREAPDEFVPPSLDGPIFTPGR